MKFRILIFSLLALSMVLAACQSTSDNKSASYPEPEAVAMQETYPDPTQVEVGPQSLYPGYKDGEEIPWMQGLSLIWNQEVKEIQTSSAPKLTLILVDGRTLVTIEPAEGMLQDSLTQCGENCKAIVVK